MTDATLIRDSYLAQIRRKRAYSTVILVIFVAMMASGFQLANGRNAGGFLSGLHRIFDFPAELIAEAVDRAANLPGLIWFYLPALVETLNIAAAATLLGALFGGFLSLMASPGLAPFPRLVPLVRRFLDITRAIPDVVIALILIFMLSSGPVPAMLAIAFHTTGALGKLFSEVNENADVKPVEGLQSVGAGWFQRMILAVLPQVAPNWLSYGLLRFEINVRASAILGFVGAGGIGAELKVAIGWGQGRYDAAAAIFILLFVTIMVIDQVSGHFRNVLVKGR
ncbi:phosphonate ABC transporter, permease protein PhnE [Falsirhodobacter sp. 20TX0035]|uniref:phosphonate ABC transporter, permease protein PhnE n=1 Tax=Falsirhodobacter sp. 20TX0035 TaxID=3022019 RepID=UPI002330B785|nr:phosphonate ABC transporter, permease protein PhnE [Falsirhodobacter sp. 20TX0035]MDB6452718.1 phosphonate ABC transporter, permease protein PhnE [Falsirhodobacter sp. 20TX0035]